jgi:hypothetical protein
MQCNTKNKVSRKDRVNPPKADGKEDVFFFLKKKKKKRRGETYMGTTVGPCYSQGKRPKKESKAGTKRKEKHRVRQNRLDIKAYTSPFLLWLENET